MPGPLHGVRILDLTTVVMGPFATQQLADLDADVIKVEAPEGDNTRHLGPMRHAGMGAIFLNMNRNKRSIVLDLKKPAGRDALLRLAATADVLIYNVRPQAMARLGLAYEDVRAVNPRILYVGGLGYGQAGPYAARPAYDDLIQGASALPWLMMKNGAPEPRYVPATVCDRIVGQAVANAVLAALFERTRSGEGQRIDVPMFETMAQFILGDHLGGRVFDPPLGPPGYARVLARHRAPYATSDGHICALVYNDKQWRSFFGIIGRMEMFERDERFNSHANRAKRIDEVYAFVAQELRHRTTAEWIRLFDEADIPYMTMNSLDDLIDDPHLAASGFFRTMHHPSEGDLRITGVPSAWSRTAPDAPRPAPGLGEHGAAILREAGYTDAEIAGLVASGATTRPA